MRPVGAGREKDNVPRLKGILAEALAPPPRTRRPTKPGKRAVDRRIAAKKRRARIKRLRRVDEE